MRSKLRRRDGRVARRRARNCRPIPACSGRSCPSAASRSDLRSSDRRCSRNRKGRFVSRASAPARFNKPTKPQFPPASMVVGSSLIRSHRPVRLSQIGPVIGVNSKKSWSGREIDRLLALSAASRSAAQSSTDVQAEDGIGVRQLAPAFLDRQHIAEAAQPIEIKPCERRPNADHKHRPIRPPGLNHATQDARAARSALASSRDFGGVTATGPRNMRKRPWPTWQTSSASDTLAGVSSD